MGKDITPYEVTSLLQIMKRKFSVIKYQMTGVVKQAKRKQAGTLNRVPKEQNLVHMLPHEY